MAGAAAAEVALASAGFVDAGTSGSHCAINAARFAGREAGTASFFLSVKDAFDENDKGFIIKIFTTPHGFLLQTYRETHIDICRAAVIQKHNKFLQVC